LEQAKLQKRRKEGKKERRKDGKKERRKEGKKERRKEGKKERRKEGKKERRKEGTPCAAAYATHGRSQVRYANPAGSNVLDWELDILAEVLLTSLPTLTL
jgi:hypothetical protein